MKKTILFSLLALLFFANFIAASQSYYFCAGDKQLSLMCPIQSQQPIQSSIAQNSHIGLGVATLIISLLFISGSGFLVYRRIKNRKKQ